LTRAIEREAQELLWMADSGWTSKNPKTRARSQEIYGQLLREYADAKVVIDSQARLSERSKASIDE
jgi:hypothetical protein